MRKFFTLALLSFIILPTSIMAQFPAPYCVEAYPNIEPITKVVFSNISNTSAVSSAPAHEDFTSVVGNVLIGSIYTMEVQGFTGGNFTTNVRVFVDWNNNGLFTDAGESFDIGSITNSTGTDGIAATSQITIPANATPGNLRMRVSKRYNVYPSACNNAGFGQAEDYTLNVVPLTQCSGIPDAGSAVSTSTNVCANTTFTLSLTNATLAGGLTYLWQSSTNNIAWSDLSGTSSSFTTTQSLPIVNYRAIVSCAGQSDTSVPVQVTTPSLVSGTYTINSNVATGSGNFQTFADAVNYIKCGINGPVVFNVNAASGPYTEQITIPQIAGASSVNTITFNGNGTAINYNTSDPNKRTAIILNGADHITIDSFNIDVSAGTYGWGIVLTNRADSNVIRKCSVLTSSSTTSSNYSGILINGSATSTSTSGNNGNGNLISDNTVTGGFYGLVVYGSTTPYNDRNIIRRNVVKDFYSYGIYLYGNTNAVVSGNDVSRPSRTGVTTTYSLYIGTNTNALIEKNRVHNLFDAATTSASIAYGIYIAGSGTAAAPNRLENNAIYNFNNGAGTEYGIYGAAYSYYNIYHNTILLDDAAATAGTTYGIYFYGTAVNVKNNIVSISRGGTGTKYCLYYNTTSSSVTSSNNNVLYMNSPAGTNNIGYYGSAYSTFVGWQAVYDQQSVNVDPVFVNAPGGDLTPSEASVNNKGANVGVTSDILNTARNVASPDPGAFEFNLGSCTNPPLPGNAVTPVSSVCAGALFSLDLSSNTFGDGQTYQWQSSPNNTANSWTNIGSASTASGYTTTQNANTYYRALVKCGTGTALPSTSVYVTSPSLVSGTFTINNSAAPSATNFITFADAINHISCGINGPVVFNVSTNIYNESVNIPPITGTSTTNTVTINGNGATVAYTTSDAANRSGIILNGADHFIIDSLVVDVSQGTYGWGIVLTNRADSNIIRKCTITNNTSSTTAANSMGIVINGSATATGISGNNGNGNLITGNTINGGGYGIYLYGSNTAFNKRNVVQNNLVQDIYSYGVYLYGNDSISVSSNEITRPNRSAVTTTYGVYISTNTNALIEKNRVHNLFDAATGSTSSCYPVYIIASGLSAAFPNRLENNLVYNINNGAGLEYGLYGAGYNNWNYYHNTVVLDDAGATAGTTYGIYVYGTAVNVKNNIVYINRGGSGTKYALYYSNVGVSSSNNNVLVMNSGTGTNGIGYYNAGYTTLADWQAANSAVYDQQSINADPYFVNAGAGDFTPGASAAGDLGAVIGVTTDILGVTRSAVAPDAGAFEFDAPPCTGSNGGTITAQANSLCGSGATMFTASGYSDGSQINYQWQSSSDNFVANVGDLPAANSPLGYSTGNITSTTDYRLKVTCAATGNSIGYSNIFRVTVSPVPTANITPANPGAVCEPATITLSLGTSSATSPLYQWQMGGGDINGANGPTYQATTSGSYRLKVTDGASLCSGFSSPSIVNINLVPSALVISPANPNACSAAQLMTASGGSISGAVLLQEDFNGATNSWTTINNSTGGTPELSSWTLQPNGFNPGGTWNVPGVSSITSNDNSQFYLSNGDIQGSGSTQNNILRSPAFSTVGFTSLNLRFFHFFQFFTSPDSAKIEVSTDGANWSLVQAYTATTGTATSFAEANLSMNAYINNPTLYVRFRYKADWGYGWAVDNVLLTGNQTTTIRWSPTAGLFTDATATTPYTGGPAPSVYAKPTNSTTYTATATSAASCTSFATTTVTGCAFPVTLINFKGERVGSINKLEWSTLTEINNVGFELQRSADGANFSVLKFIETKAVGGNSTTSLTYRFDDVKPLASTGYYRLKQLDKDGKSTYSKVVLIKGGKIDAVTFSSIYPNPVQAILNLVISSPSASSVKLIITDVSGKVVAQNQVQVATGDNQFKLPVSNLASGSYFLKAICANGCEGTVQKFVKQ